jgi:hypothetical protein
VEILYKDERRLIQDSESSSDSETPVSSGANPFSTPVLSAQIFSQTKFGSLKSKYSIRKNQTK